MTGSRSNALNRSPRRCVIGAVLERVFKDDTVAYDGWCGPRHGQLTAVVNRRAEVPRSTRALVGRGHEHCGKRACRARRTRRHSEDEINVRARIVERVACGSADVCHGSPRARGCRAILQDVVANGVRPVESRGRPSDREFGPVIDGRAEVGRRVRRDSRRVPEPCVVVEPEIPVAVTGARRIRTDRSRPRVQRRPGWLVRSVVIQCGRCVIDNVNVTSATVGVGGPRNSMYARLAREICLLVRHQLSRSPVHLIAKPGVRVSAPSCVRARPPHGEGQGVVRRVLARNEALLLLQGDKDYSSAQTAGDLNPIDDGGRAKVVSSGQCSTDDFARGP